MMSSRGNKLIYRPIRRHHHALVSSLVESDRTVSRHARGVEKVRRADHVALTDDGATLLCTRRDELATHARIRRRT
jgi:hypothetical protein